MATEGEEAVPGATPWYAKFFEYWRNRSRVGPGKVELPDCDFFIVGPRRTLRILKPTLKSGWYYENSNDRPESIVDNFFTRWSRRPHSSGNCRCSFRQSKRLSTTEEQIITAELNRIRTSLCEAEKNERAIEELEQRVSVNLQKLQVAAPENEATSVEAKSVSTIDANDRVTEENDEQTDEQTIKTKIVKDLEKYINVLLEEILDDTVKHIAGSEDTLTKDARSSKKRNDCSTSFDCDRGDTTKHEPTIEQSNDESFNEISFSFHAAKNGNESVEKSEETLSDKNEGYVNRGFIGSTNDPDSLDFYLRRSVGTEVPLEQLDCIDSGINSVETIEFQPDQEPSLEQSLLKIIDEKLGRTALRNSWEDLSTGGQEKDAHGIDISTDNLESGVPAVALKEAEETVNEPSFEKLRLEFKGNDSGSSFRAKKGGNAFAKLREKFCATTIEMEDYRKSWPNIEENTGSPGTEQNPRDLVTFRKNRKPMIVFLHGFGSSAEIFEHQLRYFSALGYPCIAPDMLGHGMSSAPNRSRDYHFSKLLKDLDTVLCYYAFKPGQKCVLVAHNYGCSFAAALACKYDSSIHQLVLISGGGPTPLTAPSTESAGHCCLRAILAPFLMCGLHRDILYSARGRQHPYCGPEPPEQWPSHMKYVLDGMVWPEGDYVFHRRICTPTLLIHGLRDNKVSLVQECQMERTMLKAFLEAIPTAGHTPMTDCPEQVNHMIHCFIDLWKNKKW
ncbi:Abhydrolase domain-containing protein 8 [Habropoda laboriosa]|uniref:acylglycerol lipase n=1 Tax=Habropoda laboriosa TaxID=597456 RepID=A0A0L7R8X3_9HYME|nr:Abhydrolase domain-containing protein 8 [Habropoda laboriosa]